MNHDPDFGTPFRNPVDPRVRRHVNYSKTGGGPTDCPVNVGQAEAWKACWSVLQEVAYDELLECPGTGVEAAVAMILKLADKAKLYDQMVAERPEEQQELQVLTVEEMNIRNAEA